MRIIRHARHYVSQRLSSVYFFALFLWLFLPGNAAFSQSQQGTKVTLKVSEVSLVQVIRALEHQTKYEFRYTDDLEKDTQKYSFHFVNKPFNEILDVVCTKAKLAYRINGKTVSLRALTVNSKKSSSSISVKGIVSDPNGNQIVGVTVRIKGTSSAVMTNQDGAYAIKNVPNESTLLFSFIGMKDVEIPVNGKKTIDVLMEDGKHSIDEVVVTALGISREEKALGYAVTKLDNSDITQSVSGNWISELEGKVPGLILQQASSGPSSSYRVTLRGDHSLNYGNNEALFVVDGVPINSSMTATSSVSNYAQGDAPIDYGNAVSDINPDDIASVTVLKGPAASALYGSRAANGAIVITTKSGRKIKGIGITLNSTISFDKAGYFPDFQTEYGNGSDLGEDEYSIWNLTADMTQDGKAVSRNYSRYTFGEKFDASQMRYLYSSKDWDTDTYTKKPWVYQKDWYTGLFQTGVTTNNTITIDGNNGNGTNSRISFTNMNNKWILPNTGFKKQNVAISFTSPLNKYINLIANINYYHKQSDNMPGGGYAAGNPLYQLVWGFNVNSIKDWKDEYFNGRFNYNNLTAMGENGNGLVYPASGSYNPFRTLYEETNSQNKDRIFGNMVLSFNIAKNLSLNLRSGLDASNEFRVQKKPYYTTNYQKGFYREQTIRNFEINNDFMLRYANNNWLEKRLGFSAMFGGNSMTQTYYNYKITLEQLGIEGVYNTSNLPEDITPDLYNYRSTKKVNSFYGLASLSWQDTYFLDITGRNDWSSTLSPGNWSYFYPSVAGSVLLDQIFHLSTKTNWINLLKWRISWANVGNDTTPYNLDNYYKSTSYSGGYELPSTITNSQIKPENNESWETGFATRLFNNRVSLDVAAYYSSSTNQILAVTIDQITGATGMNINAGKLTDKGLEIAANFVPVKTRNFTWSFNVNWATNKNKLVKLQDGWDASQPYQTSMGTTVGGRVYVYSYVGQEMNYIYGKGYQRAPKGSYYTDDSGKEVDASGKIIVNSSGYPTLDDSPDRKIGKVNPDWRGGITQHFKYKNISLSAQFTAQMGGHAYSVTNFSLSYQGKLKNSLEGRYDGLVVDGVNEVTNSDGTTSYTKNTTVTSSIETYYNSYVWNRDNAETNTFKTDFLKLKLLNIDYQLPKRVCKSIGFLQKASVGAYATNLFCLTKFPQYDPETGMLYGSNIYQGIESMSMPMTRSYGFNMKLSF